MKKEDIVKILDAELKNAEYGYNFHRASGNKYNLQEMFKGQMIVIRRLKRKLINAYKKQKSK